MSDNYWTVSYGVACRTGFSCRECKKVINKNEPIAVRDGRKMRFFYHRQCFSGSGDPRTQSGSTFNQGRLPSNSFQGKAPERKGQGKWSVSSYGYNPSGTTVVETVKASKAPTKTHGTTNAQVKREVSKNNFSSTKSGQKSFQTKSDRIIKSETSKNTRNNFTTMR
ncbi:hypothetical protein TrispH2_004702 [Trichoplax sp. H2]|uniref:PARP-type domain-containing protein n=1 Tax=Trichoplax adhaerens TaxID=10228 RepID=B3RUS3_TRIAD|nr:predicted protein [Trichoplax adhaerens]EDV25872.1 predicted protein [Trichoplax adhaerens]RDD43792.1 hypothetical protein TrispH2_004702 [Trichoplax sp. H2]|eukprot:XP_002111905.1 predicted protein [Trichoplax adhaerens]